MSNKILIIDDEPDIRELIELTLTRMGHETKSAANVQAAKQLLASERFHAVLTDMRLPDGDGMEIIEYIGTNLPELPVAMLTAHGNMDAAIKAMKLGAFDFVSKPIDITTLRQLVTNALKLSANPATPAPAAPASAPVGSKAPASSAADQAPAYNATTAPVVNAPSGLIGSSESMAQLTALIAKVARSQAPVYIHGASGTGKELVANSIHQQSARADGAFVPVNCSAIPSELLESEFFGHVKGSFTGALADKDGLFTAANGGTLFLDEIADLPINMQVKLLRAIQEKTVRPVGANHEIKIDVRIISASHKDLATLVAQNLFRQDLFYRINVIRIDVPDLKDRGADCLQIAKFVLAKIGARDNSAVFKLSDSAELALRRYPFPGNVRELENILERACALCDGKKIEVEDLQLPKPSMQFEPELSAANAQNLPDALALSEADSIRNALKTTYGNKTEAAKLLGLTFRQLRYRIKKLAIED